VRTRALGFARWLKWGGWRHRCPVCGRRFRRHASGECPFCFANERTRELFAYLAKRDLSGWRILHVAPELGLGQRLREHCAQYVAVDLQGLNGAQRADLTNLPFADQSFDLLICSHVLEHVPDDRRALAEIRRVAAAALLVHPVEAGREFTDETPVPEYEREARFGQFDHVRAYGTDLVQRVQQAGFHVERLDNGPQGYRFYDLWLWADNG
jgi:SAM-dependent methyltransferase